MPSGRLTIDHFMEELATRDASAIAMRERIAVMIETGAGFIREEGIVRSKVYRISGAELLDMFPTLAAKIRQVPSS